MNVKKIDKIEACLAKAGGYGRLVIVNCLSGDDHCCVLVVWLEGAVREMSE